MPNEIAHLRPSDIDPRTLPASLADSIRSATDEIDRTGVLPVDLVQELRGSGAFRLLTPQRFGGFEAPLTAALSIYEEFGKLDAAVAWVVWNANFGFIGALMDQDGATEIWDGNSEPLFSNSGMPGKAVPVAGGFEVSGTWKVVSGIQHSDWLVVVAVVMDGKNPQLTESGTPDVRLFPLRRETVEVLPTWRVSGMRGTGSNNVTADASFVSASLVARFDVPSRIDSPLYRGFVPTLVFAGCSAIVLGIAQATIDELVEVATGNHADERARTQFVVGKSEAALSAARLLLHSASDALRREEGDDRPVSIEQRAAFRAAMSHAAATSREVLVSMYELGSSTSIHVGNRLERLMRDGMVALQHANHSELYFEVAGKVRFDIDPELGLF